MAATLTFLTPIGILLALGGLLPLVALVLIVRHAARVRSRLGITRPVRVDWSIPLVALMAASVLVGLAAAQPILERTTTRRVAPTRRCSSRSTSRARCSRAAVPGAYPVRAREGGCLRAPRTALRRPRRSRFIHRPRAAAPVPDRERRCVRGNRRSLHRDRTTAAGLEPRDERDEARRALSGPQPALLCAAARSTGCSSC